MKSVVMCEGSDDLWFIGYYLHKTAGWMQCKKPEKYWKNYRIPTVNPRQKVGYFEKDGDCVAVWSVAGKDCFDSAISTIIDKVIPDYPFDPINSIVIVRDHDSDDIADAMENIGSWFWGHEAFENGVSSPYDVIVDDERVTMLVTPVVIPAEESGAIETLLTSCIESKGRGEKIIVREAHNYISKILTYETVQAKYLRHERDRTKAKYSAVIAAINPAHSTALFQEMVMSCDWETSELVKKHYDIVVKAITT